MKSPKSPEKRFSIIKRQNSILTNQKLNIQKKEIINFIIKKILLITIIFFCLNLNANYFPYEKIIIKKLQNIFFPLTNIKMIINEYFLMLLNFFSINLFFLITIFYNKNKYQNILIIFFILFFRVFFNIIFQNSRPFWKEKFEVYICKRDYSVGDNIFFLIFIFFVIKNEFFKNNILFFFSSLLFFIYKFILFINANIFFSNFILDFFFIFLYYDIYFYTKNFFMKYDIFEKLTKKKIIYLFFIWIFMNFILNQANQKSIDVIKYNNFENIVF